MLATNVKATVARLAGTPSEGIVMDTTAMRIHAANTLAALESRTPAEQAAAFEKRKEIAALGGVADLNAIEGDYYTLNIHRDSPTLDFVEMRDLPLGTIPIYRTRTENPVGVFQGGLAGHGSTLYYATQDTAVQVTPFTLQTEEVMVPNLNNIYNMETLQQRVVGRKRLAEYMDIGVTNCALNTMLGATDLIATDPAAQIVTYFGTGGSFAGKNVYKLDNGVVAAGVPSLNVYDLTTEGGITKNVLKTLNTHRTQLGVKIRKIYIPSAGAPWEALQNQASLVALTNGQGNQNPSKAVTPEEWAKFQSMDVAGQFSVPWGGQTFVFEKQNWLPQGYCLVLMDAPAVIMWSRLKLQTGDAAEGTLETPVNGYYNKMSVAQNFAMAQPTFCLKSFAVIKVQ